MQTKIKTALLEAQVFKAGRRHLDNEGFVEMFPPRIVRASGACENVNTLFEVSSGKNFKWFGSGDNGNEKYQSYLAQTGQLYLEGFVPYLKKVYCVGPSFRAEPGNDNRHLTEFQMMEIEFAGNFDELLAHIEKFIYAIVENLIQLPTAEQKEMGLTPAHVARLAKRSRFSRNSPIPKRSKDWDSAGATTSARKKKANSWRSSTAIRSSSRAIPTRCGIMERKSKSRNSSTC